MPPALEKLRTQAPYESADDCLGLRRLIAAETLNRFLRDFGTRVEAQTGQWPIINIDTALHAKYYLFSKGGDPYAGIVTSANLTHKGLNVNHETGLLLADTNVLQDLCKDARSDLAYIHLTEYQINKLCDIADYIKDQVGPIPPSPVGHDIGLRNTLKMYCTPGPNNHDIQLKASAKYYIKVSGVRDDPILPSQRIPFDQPRRELSFATNPNKIRIGDCLLEVAVGGKCFLGYYVCASEVAEKTAEEKRRNEDDRRWPFYVFGNNLSLRYGKEWFERPLYYDEAIERFQKENPGISVTVAGTDSFKGAISFGSSYIQVTQEFGEFVRREIDKWK